MATAQYALQCFRGATSRGLRDRGCHCAMCPPAVPLGESSWGTNAARQGWQQGFLLQLSQCCATLDAAAPKEN